MGRVAPENLELAQGYHRVESSPGGDGREESPIVRRVETELVSQADDGAIAPSQRLRRAGPDPPEGLDR